MIDCGDDAFASQGKGRGEIQLRMHYRSLDTLPLREMASASKGIITVRVGGFAFQVLHGCCTGVAQVLAELSEGDNMYNPQGVQYSTHCSLCCDP
jgi:hypothetical protein